MSFLVLSLVGCSDNNSGPGAGTLLAGVTAATLGTVADLPAEAVVEATTKVVAQAAAMEASQASAANTPANNNASTNALPNPAQNKIETATVKKTSGGSGGFVVNELYQYSCPMTGRKSAPIKAKSMECAKAMRIYAKAAGCNEVHALQSAQNAYYQACASEMYR